jgi:hypothetical protein
MCKRLLRRPEKVNAKERRTAYFGRSAIVGIDPIAGIYSHENEFTESSVIRR